MYRSILYLFNIGWKHDKGRTSVQRWQLTFKLGFFNDNQSIKYLTLSALHNSQNDKIIIFLKEQLSQMIAWCWSLTYFWQKLICWSLFACPPVLLLIFWCWGNVRYPTKTSEILIFSLHWCINLKMLSSSPQRPESSDQGQGFVSFSFFSWDFVSQS